MERATYPYRLRLLLAILPVFLLLAGTWGQGFASAAEAMTVVLCSDGVMKTVTLDPDDTGRGPQDCRDCPACAPPLPAVLSPAAHSLRPADRESAVHPRRTGAAVLVHRACGPLSRGPPRQFPWFRA